MCGVLTFWIKTKVLFVIMFLILHNVCYCFYTLYRLAFMKLNLFENWKHTTQCQQLACHPMVLATLFSGLKFWFIFQWRNFYWLGFLETEFFANSIKICFAILRIATFAYYYYSSLWLSIEKTNKKQKSGTGKNSFEIIFLFALHVFKE